MPALYTAGVRRSVDAISSTGLKQIQPTTLRYIQYQSGYFGNEIAWTKASVQSCVAPCA